MWDYWFNHGKVAMTNDNDDQAIFSPLILIQIALNAIFCYAVLQYLLLSIFKIETEIILYQSIIFKMR